MVARWCRGVVASSGRFGIVVRRLAWGAAVLWLVATITWAIIYVLPDERPVYFTMVDMGFAVAYEDPPGPLRLYLDWLWSFLTLQWGTSREFDAPVVALYRSRLPVTLVYVVPGALASVVVGTGVASYASMRPGGPLDRLLSLTSYVSFSLPAFILAQTAFLLLPNHIGWIQVYDRTLGLWHPQNVARLSLPAGIVALNFLAVQVRYTRGETREYLDASFVRTARSKGAGRFRLAVHVFRNAWPSLASLVVGEALGVLLLSTIVVETILEIPGIAVVVYRGFAGGDPMVTFTAVFLVVLLGVLGTLARDVARLLFDPRVES